MKLTLEQRAEIVAAHRAGATQTALAKKYGVTQPTIFRIVRPDAWTKTMLHYLNKLLKRLEASEGGPT